MSPRGGHHRRRRLLGAVGAIAVLAALGAPEALADPGPGFLEQVTESVIPAAPQPAADAAPPAAAPLLNTVVTTATNAVNDPVGTVTKVVNDPVGTVSETVAPAVETVQETTQQTLGSVTESTAPLTNALGLSSSLGQTTSTVGQTTNALGETVRDTTGAAAGTPGSPGGPPGAPASPDVVAAPTSGATPGAAAVGTTFDSAASSPISPAGPNDKDLVKRGHASELAIMQSSAPVAADAARPTTPAPGAARSSRQPHAPLPDTPSGPLTALFSASASVGGGALAFLLAALAAATLLAAPGLGRRLRPRLAPWPQPILQLSIERPG